MDLLIIHDSIYLSHSSFVPSQGWIVATGTGEINATTVSSLTYNTTNPLRKDVSEKSLESCRKEAELAFFLSF